jgi:hypothetical protein
LGPPLNEDDAVAATERSLSEAVHVAFVVAGGVEMMLRVAGKSGPPDSAGAACASVFYTFKTLGSSLREPFQKHGGIEAMVRVLVNPYVNLGHRAAAAGNLWYYLVPDGRGGPPAEGTESTLKRMQQQIAAKESGGKVASGGCVLAAASLSGLELVLLPDVFLHVGRIPPKLDLPT